MGEFPRGEDDQHQKKGTRERTKTGDHGEGGEEDSCRIRHCDGRAGKVWKARVSLRLDPADHRRWHEHQAGRAKANLGPAFEPHVRSENDLPRGGVARCPRWKRTLLKEAAWLCIKSYSFTK